MYVGYTLGARNELWFFISFSFSFFSEGGGVG